MLKHKYFKFDRDGIITLFLDPDDITAWMVVLIVKDCIAHARLKKIRKPRFIECVPTLTDAV